MDFIFGYGSIINDFSRLSTLGFHKTADSVIEYSHHSAGGLSGDESIPVVVSEEFEYERAWCFRSSTGSLIFIPRRIQYNNFKLGFTALGLRRKYFSKLSNSANKGLNGVIFPVQKDQMTEFDTREVGYDRIEVPISLVLPQVDLGHQKARKRSLDFKDLQYSVIEGMRMIF